MTKNQIYKKKNTIQDLKKCMQPYYQFVKKNKMIKICLLLIWGDIHNKVNKDCFNLHLKNLFIFWQTKLAKLIKYRIFAEETLKYSIFIIKI